MNHWRYTAIVQACDQDEGIDYGLGSLQVEEIGEGQEYEGVRVALTGWLHQHHGARRPGQHTT
jgi:hypothetical protein